MSSCPEPTEHQILVPWCFRGGGGKGSRDVQGHSLSHRQLTFPSTTPSDSRPEYLLLSSFYTYYSLLASYHCSATHLVLKKYLHAVSTAPIRLMTQCHKEDGFPEVLGQCEHKARDLVSEFGLRLWIYPLHPRLRDNWD
jgi:hypothetical protein